jgi:uroporphyrinogen-III decarboxylase
VRTEQDLRVLGCALGTRTFTPRWDLYQAWAEYVGDGGVVCLPLGYSAMGYLLNLWMGVEATMYAIADWPDTMRQVVNQINQNNLKLIDMVAASPVEIVLLGDNFSSDIQPPHFFNEWSRTYYAEAVRRLRASGKYVAVHIDGKLRGALKMIRDVGADCADAVTPTPMGDLTPAQCREEAGPDFILSGGVSPDLWLPGASVEDFKRAVIQWLDLKRYSPRLIANAGDQVPPGAAEERIEIMRELVEKFGRY